uniref:SFRICE_000514 n=1 Tax=Spodoptera frugiperda TaxID=7108 RepID=A0A2H1VBM3_SPOFR
MAFVPFRLFLTSDLPQLRLGAMLIYYSCFIHINRSLESLYLLKKPHQIPLRNIKDLSKQTDIASPTIFITTALNIFSPFKPSPFTQRSPLTPMQLQDKGLWVRFLGRANSSTETGTVPSIIMAIGKHPITWDL